MRQETFISADDLRVNLWHLDVTDQCFTIVDIKPPNMEDLTEVRFILLKGAAYMHQASGCHVRVNKAGMREGLSPDSSIQHMNLALLTQRWSEE